jgi:5'-nucleotidase
VRILVSNDDGIHTEGIAALAEAMADYGEVWVVAPQTEQSGVGRAITLNHPLRVERFRSRERWISVSGTPTDCVYLALNHFMRENRPDLVVSGINHGSNLGTDAHYSGTVSAAKEGMANGISSMAFSLVAYSDFDFSVAARFAHQMVGWVKDHPLPPGVMLNCNVPRDASGGFAICRQGTRTYDGLKVDERLDPRGRRYYWIGGTEINHAGCEQTDTAAHDAGLISIVPLVHDMTAYDALSGLAAVALPSFACERLAKGTR